MVFSYTWCAVCFCCFKDFQTFFCCLLAFLLWFVCMWVSEFILVGVYWTSWIYRLIFFIKFDKFLAIIIFQTNFSVSFSLSSPSNLPIMHMFIRLIESYFLKFFFSLCSSSWIICSNISFGLLFLSYNSSDILLSRSSNFLPSYNLYLIFSTWWNIAIISSFISLSIVSFGS